MRNFSFVSVFLCVLRALVCGELLRFPSSKRGLRGVLIAYLHTPKPPLFRGGALKDA